MVLAKYGLDAHVEDAKAQLKEQLVRLVNGDMARKQPFNMSYSGHHCHRQPYPIYVYDDNDHAHAGSNIPCFKDYCLEVVCGSKIVVRVLISAIANLKVCGLPVELLTAIP